MKTELLFATPEFLSNPYFSIGFFVLTCVFAFLWVKSAYKASNSELDLSIRGALMSELQSKLNFVNSALELSKRNERENEAIIKSLKYDLKQEKAELVTAIAKTQEMIKIFEIREKTIAILQDEIAKFKNSSLITIKPVKVVAKTVAKTAVKPAAKPKAVKPRSLGIED
jgi:hypothetical protein